MNAWACTICGVSCDSFLGLEVEAAFHWSRWLTALDINDDGAPYTLSAADVAGIRMECLYSQTRGFRRAAGSFSSLFNAYVVSTNR